MTPTEIIIGVLIAIFFHNDFIYTLWLNYSTYTQKKTYNKNALGIEFLSDWDIFNVAQALPSQLR